MTKISPQAASPVPSFSAADTYDVIVIGGGSGGCAAALRAASHGVRVLLVDAGGLGGTCVHRGCVPKKLNWAAAHVSETLRQATAWGFPEAARSFDAAAFRHTRTDIIAILAGRYRRSLEQAGVEVVNASARLTGPRAVALSPIDNDDYAGVSGEPPERVVTGQHVLIAVGGQPTRPKLPGAELGWTSDDLWSLDTLPKRLVIVGGGYIGVEQAAILNRLGVEVTLVVQGMPLVPQFDPALMKHLTQHYRSANIGIVVADSISAERLDDGTLKLKLKPRPEADPPSATETPPLPPSEIPTAIETDAILWATGRVAALEGLGLDALNLAYGKKGLPTDACGQSTDPRYPWLYAIGDCGDCGLPQLTPVAIAQGRRWADRCFGGKNPPDINPDHIPTAAFSIPVVAQVGPSEKKAREKYGAALAVYETVFRPLAWVPEIEGGALPTDARASIRLLVQGPDEHLVGLQAIGPGADEVVQMFAPLLTVGARHQDLTHTVPLHPCFGEEALTLKKENRVA